MRKTFTHVFAIADYEEEEVWLRKKHREGWKIVRMIPPCFYVFESCEPQDVIYRLDYKNSMQTLEYMQMLTDFGWEYVCSCTGWLYFRKPAAEAESAQEGELFSDNASRVELASSVIKTRFIPLAIIFLCGVIPGLLNSVSMRFGAVSGIFSGIFGVMFVLYVFLIAYCGVKLQRIRSRYRG